MSAVSVTSTTSRSAGRPVVASVAAIASTVSGSAASRGVMLTWSWSEPSKSSFQPATRAAATWRIIRSISTIDRRQLGDRDELVGRDEAAGRVLPTGEGLDRDETLRVDVEDRLEPRRDLAADDRAIEIAAELRPRQRVLVHLGLEHRVRPAAALLRPVHRDIGPAEDLLGGQFEPVGARRCRSTPGSGTPGRRAARRRANESRIRWAIAIAVSRRVARPDDDRELVAAEPCDVRLVGTRSSQAIRHLAQEHVAERVAERVVDPLEVVEIEEHDGRRARPGERGSSRSEIAARFGSPVNRSGRARRSSSTAAPAAPRAARARRGATQQPQRPESSMRRDAPTRRQRSRPRDRAVHGR